MNQKLKAKDCCQFKTPTTTTTTTTTANGNTSNGNTSNGNSTGKTATAATATNQIQKKNYTNKNLPPPLIHETMGHYPYWRIHRISPRQRLRLQLPALQPTTTTTTTTTLVLPSLLPLLHYHLYLNQP